ncbi:hypothetical protein SLS62_010710 [Diatrype stigma]|uniref:Uncharacterized protein n=1 Tax=Diatrype stigma TaxID=117547 RepID=A0AAN9UGI6_9PEZI
MPVAFWFELYSKDRKALIYYLGKIQEKINPLLISKWVKDIPADDGDKRLGLVAIQTYRQNIHVQLTNIAYHDPYMMGTMFQANSIMKQIHVPVPRRLDGLPIESGQPLAGTSPSPGPTRDSASPRDGGGESSTSTVAEGSQNLERSSTPEPEEDAGGGRGREKRPSPEADSAESTQAPAKRPRHNDDAKKTARSPNPRIRRATPSRILPLQFSTSGSQPADCQRQDHDHNDCGPPKIRLPAEDDRSFPLRLAVMNSILHRELNSAPESAPDSVSNSAPDSAPESAPDSAPDSAPESAPDSVSNSVPNSPPNSHSDGPSDGPPDGLPDTVSGQTETEDIITIEEQNNPVCIFCKRADTTWVIDVMTWSNQAHQGLITCPDCALAPENFREVNVMYRGPMVSTPYQLTCKDVFSVLAVEL